MAKVPVRLPKAEHWETLQRIWRHRHRFHETALLYHQGLHQGQFMNEYVRNAKAAIKKVRRLEDGANSTEAEALVRKHFC